MVTTSADFNVLALVGIIVSGFVGTGAVAFFVRYGTRLTILERAVESSQLQTLHPRLSRVEDAISDMKQLLPKLNILEVILNRVDGISSALMEMVPRKEHEVRWQRTDERFDDVQQRLRELTHAEGNNAQALLDVKNTHG